MSKDLRGDLHGVRSQASSHTVLLLAHQGKAEPFIQDAMRDRAYVHVCGAFDQRINALPRWLQNRI